MVESTDIEEVSDIVFLEEEIKVLPDEIKKTSQHIVNCSDIDGRSNISLNVSSAQRYSVSKSKSVSTTNAFTLSLNYGSKIGFGGGNTSFSHRSSISNSTSISESSSKTVNRSFSISVNVKPKTKTSISMLVYETTIDIPFRANIVIDGNLKHNSSGMSRASQFLSKEQRTIIFEGVLSLTDASESIIKMENIPHISCSESTGLSISKVDESLGAIDISDDELSKYKSLREFLKEVDVVNDFLVSKSFSEIAPLPDGVSYEIIYTTNVARQSFACGFDELGMANLGEYSVEGRQYYEYLNNELIATWFEEEEVFIGCLGI